MRLQKQLSRKSGNKEYAKWVLVVPPEKITQLGWKEGTELKDDVDKEVLKIRPLTKEELNKEKEQPIYQEFRDGIENLLKRHPLGLTWTEIKDKMNFPQQAPNNQWVKKLEEDIGLKRIKVGGTTIWKLENNIVFTIGYEGLKIEDFIDKLMQEKIEQLIDVREIAFSRKNGFSKGLLDQYLREAGIRYKHFNYLGSPKGIRDKLHQDWDYKEFFSEYTKHINDQEVQEELRDLEGLAKMRKTAIMCFEKDFSKCHRSIISQELRKKGWKIVHLNQPISHKIQQKVQMTLL